MFTDKLDDRINKRNNTNHNAIKTNVISDLKDEEIFGTFYEKKLQKTNQKEFRVGKVIKGKDNKLYVKWKGYNSFFNPIQMGLFGTAHGWRWAKIPRSFKSGKHILQL